MNSIVHRTFLFSFLFLALTNAETNAQLNFSDPIFLGEEYPEYADPTFDIADVNGDGFKDVVIGARGGIILNIRNGNQLFFEEPIFINTRTRQRR